jgi:TPP-dependent pyruvate/acetoin dehydrogenase alpha subunit
MIPIAAGIALASRMRREDAVVMNYIGDGGCNVGDFHEAMNMAAVMQLPLVLLIENNQFAYSTPNQKQFACQKLSDRAQGYGVPGVTVDGTDVTRVYEACVKAVQRARNGQGPSIIETITMRMHGHSAADDASYVPREMLEQWKKKDPLEKLERMLMSERVLTEEKKKEIETRIAGEIEEAIGYALNAPHPSGENAVKGVFAP